MNLERGHQKLDEQITSLYAKLQERGKPKKFTYSLSLKYRVTDQTILNYLKGKGSDGLLKKAIIKSLKQSLK